MNQPSQQGPTRRPRPTRSGGPATNALLAGGGVLVIFGLLFFLQGLGVVNGSPMTGVTLWAIIGPILALIGVALLVIGWRRRSA